MNGKNIQGVKLLRKIMFNIEGVLSHEIEYEITKEQLGYIFIKFLLANGAFKEFVKEYINYHKLSKLEAQKAKDIIIESIDNLKSDGRSINDIITAYSSAFDWWNTSKGSEYWAALHDKWYDVTKRRFLKEIFVK